MMLRRVSKNKHTLALLAILLLAGSLRFYGLEIQSLWADELSTWYNSGKDNLSEVIAMARAGRQEATPPGYFILMYFIEKYFGDSESLLRLPSAVAGVLSVPVIYLLGRRLYSQREGLIAALLLAVLWCPVYYSQEARAYSLLLLFALLATYFWVAVVRDLAYRSRVSVYEALGYVLSAAAASYLHYFGFYLIGLQGLAATLLFVRRVRPLGYLILIYGLILFAYLPWLLVVLGGMGQFGTAMSLRMNWLPSPKPEFFIYYLEFLFNDSIALVGVVLTLYLFLLLKGLRWLFKRRGNLPGISDLFLSPGMLLALWLVVPFAGVYAISVLWSPFLLNRALIISLPAAYLLAARAITQLPLRPKVQVGLVTVAAVLLLSHLLFSKDYYTEPHKEQFREAMRFVIENDRPNSFIVACGLGYFGPDYPPLKAVWYPDNPQKRSLTDKLDYYRSEDKFETEKFNYYLEEQGSSRRVQAAACQAQDMSTLEDLVKRKGYPYVFYVQVHNKPYPKKPLIRSLENKFELVRHKQLFGAEVHLFKVQ
jgi:mannosyltransferase